MKPVFILIALTGVLILGGCGAMGALEEENTELQDKVDSLSMVQHAMKERVNYLETENTKLDSRNKQLKDRIDQSGSLTPPEYTVTNGEQLYTQPVDVRSVPQNRPQQPTQEVTANPQVSTPHGAQTISPNPGAAPWRAEQQAIQTGAANPQLEGKENWTYNGQSAGASNGYTYRDNSPSASHGGYTYHDNSASANQGGYTYKSNPQSQSSTQQPSRWSYNNQSAPDYNSEYSKKFDSRPQGDNAWKNPRTAPTEPPAMQPRVQPTQPVSPQAEYERQAQQQMQRQAMPEPQPQPVAPAAGLPPSRVDVSRSEAARVADYSYLARYQQGYDAYKAGQYAESVRILSELSANSEVNNTSDNTDFWIAESYYAMRDYASAKVYYSRVLSYPRSDKADEAGARLRQLH